MSKIIKNCVTSFVNNPKVDLGQELKLFREKKWKKTTSWLAKGANHVGMLKVWQYEECSFFPFNIDRQEQSRCQINQLKERRIE